MTTPVLTCICALVTVSKIPRLHDTAHSSVGDEASKRIGVQSSMQTCAPQLSKDSFSVFSPASVGFFRFGGNVIPRKRKDPPTSSSPSPSASLASTSTPTPAPTPAPPDCKVCWHDHHLIPPTWKRKALPLQRRHYGIPKRVEFYDKGCNKTTTAAAAGTAETPSTATIIKSPPASASTTCILPADQETTTHAVLKDFKISRQSQSLIHDIHKPCMSPLQIAPDDDVVHDSHTAGGDGGSDSDDTLLPDHDNDDDNDFASLDSAIDPIEASCLDIASSSTQPTNTRPFPPSSFSNAKRRSASRKRKRSDSASTHTLPSMDNVSKLCSSPRLRGVHEDDEVLSTISWTSLSSGHSSSASIASVCSRCDYARTCDRCLISAGKVPRSNVIEYKFMGCFCSWSCVWSFDLFNYAGAHKDLILRARMEFDGVPMTEPLHPHPPFCVLEAYSPGSGMSIEKFRSMYKTKDTMMELFGVSEITYDMVVKGTSSILLNNELPGATWKRNVIELMKLSHSKRRSHPSSTTTTSSHHPSSTATTTTAVNSSPSTPSSISQQQLSTDPSSTAGGIVTVPTSTQRKYMLPKDTFISVKKSAAKVYQRRSDDMIKRECIGNRMRHAVEEVIQGWRKRDHEKHLALHPKSQREMVQTPINDSDINQALTTMTGDEWSYVMSHSTATVNDSAKHLLATAREESKQLQHRAASKTSTSECPSTGQSKTPVPIQHVHLGSSSVIAPPAALAVESGSVPSRILKRSGHQSAYKRQKEEIARRQYM